MHRPAVAFVMLLVVAACSSSAPQTTRRPRTCEPLQLDPVWNVSAPVYRSCEVERTARSTGMTPRVIWSPPQNPQECNTAMVEFVVDSLGIPEARGVRVVRATDQDLAAALIASIPGRRYSAATKDGRTVRQVVRESTVLAVTRTVTVSSGPGQGPPTLPPRMRIGTTCKA